MITPIKIPGLPLYWRTTDCANAPRPDGIPSCADFFLTFDSTLGLIRQEVGPAIVNSLEAVYRAEANVGYLQIGQSLAESYGQDLWRFIQKTISQLGTRNTALEIGCGGCYILDLLLKSGISAKGIDPSPIAVRTASDLNFKVIEGFFPHPDTEGPFDLILHSDVLEHTVDPVSFLREQRARLSPGGLVITSVPDCTQSYARGDLSMIIHQHINYFDEISLETTMRSAGLTPRIIEKSNFGGSLYCTAQLSETSITPRKRNSSAVYDNFCREAKRVVDRFSTLINDALACGKSVGCYVPLRSFPYLALSGHLEKVRLFDDSAEMATRFFDGVSRRVENLEDLCDDPVDLVFVMSYSFGESVKKKIISRLANRCRIVTLDDLSQ